jgi:pimeloyl-ACP methyl ester carboxylesterase
VRKLRVNDYDMAYLDVGGGVPLVCVHGSLCDFRVWSPIIGLLSPHARVIVPSLRHYFPEHWDGEGDDFGVAQHVADVIGFIERLGMGAVNLIGHSRGGYVAFRVARERPDILASLVLAEPAGYLDPSLSTVAMPTSLFRTALADAVAMVKVGNIDAGLAAFLAAIDDAGAWQRLDEARRQELRDNATTMIGQMRDGLLPFTRADAEGLRVPTLFIGGAQSQPASLLVLRALATHVPGANTVVIPEAGHAMFVHRPQAFSAAVVEPIGRSP